MTQIEVETAPSNGRDPYYHAIFEAFLLYIADGEPFSMRTSEFHGSTDVTLRFKTETFSPYMAHLKDRRSGAQEPPRVHRLERGTACTLAEAPVA